MSDVNHGADAPRGHTKLFSILLAIAILAAIAGLGWSYHLSGRLTHAEAELIEAQQQNKKLASALDQTNARLKVKNQTPGHSPGITRKQLEQRARDLLSKQAGSTPGSGMEIQTAPENAGPTATASAGPENAFSELKADGDLLESMEGDLGAPSGWIATDQQGLIALQQKGERDYFPFTLQQGKKQSVSTVGLKLEDTNVNHGLYTLTVYADGKEIEKKDRVLNEPVQFYTGAAHSLYELVVNRVEKGTATGYLATPKGAED